VAREVAILGSAGLGPDDPEWEDARALGAALAARGATVVTGGYGGLMAAAAQGAAAAGGHVVGLPMRAWTHLAPDHACRELRWAGGYPERLGALLACDAVVALPGGVGTLSELAVAWAAAQTEGDAPVVVVMGERWGGLMTALASLLVVGPADLALVRLAHGATEAAALALEPASAAALGARG
jgi:uncharacterized protein (TIGR00725 family)